jgi:membrane fusion protein, multidrug efflux system
VTDIHQDNSAPAQSNSSRARWIAIGALAILAILYFVPIPFVAYTSDAYVRSDFVQIAPEVAGVVDHVDVANDQKVAVGALLATLNPEPFELAVDLDKTRVERAESAAKVTQDDARVFAVDLDTAKAGVTLAQKEYERIAVLVKDGAVSQAVLDRSVDDKQKALDAVAGVQAKARINAAAVASALANVRPRKRNWRSRDTTCLGPVLSLRCRGS